MEKIKKYEKAIECFCYGARNKYLPSLYRKAKMYGLGIGVDKDVSKCKSILEEARDGGHIVAKRDLAGMLISGKYGTWSRITGILMFLSLLWDIVYVYKYFILHDREIEDKILW